MAVTERIVLTTTSYVVLGLVGAMEPVTSYAMKLHVAQSIGYFWPFPHSQLYAEPARLTSLGLLGEDAEAGGRKRKNYRLTPTGRRALSQWLAEPTAEPTEIRDLGLLKLFFGAQATAAQREALAAEQHRSHTTRRTEYEVLREAVAEVATAPELATLEMGLRFERAAVAFWAELLEEGS